MPALYKGKQEVEVEGPVRVIVLSDGDFYAYLLSGKKKGSILGPPRSSDRACSFVLDSGTNRFRIECSNTVNLELKYVELTDGLEYPESTPVAIPFGYDKPLPLREELQRYVRTQLSVAADRQGFDSIEEANDFDCDDPDGDLHSPYEFAELQDEYIPPEPEEGEPEGPSKSPSPGDGDGGEDKAPDVAEPPAAELALAAEPKGPSVG